jgi:hypothetical protein
VATLIDRAEWRWLALWTLAILTIVNVPYLLGAALSSPESVFGGVVYNVEDVNTYLAKMRHGAQGEWLFHIVYTSEEHPGTFLYSFYILLGKTAALVGMPLEWAYHLARLLSGAVLLATVYLFLARFSPYRAVRRAAFVLIALSGGSGWLLVLLGRPNWLGMLPLDMILPEAYVFLTLYSSPHIALATACILWGVLLLEGPGSVWRLLAATVVLSIAASIGAFYMLVPYAVLGADWAIRAIQRRRPDWPAAGRLALSGVVPALLIAYNYYVFTFEPVYRAWAAQNLVRSPHPLHYLAAYPIVGGLALVGILHAIRRKRWTYRLPIAWAILTPLLVYLPFNMQRRLIVGAPVPLGLLAGVGLVEVVALSFGRSRLVHALCQHPRYTRAGMRRWLIALVLLITVPTNLLLVLGNCVEVARRAPPIFHSKSELEAMDWLRAHTDPKDTVLCAYETGNYVPARAGNRVFLGLGSETVDSARKRVEVSRFFDAAATDAWRQQLLAENHIAYVLIGPNERALGTFDPKTVPYLLQVYVTDRAPGYAVYRATVGA